MNIADNIITIKNRIDNVLKATGRKSEDVTLIGVTKNADADAVGQAFAAGVADFGENRVQELLGKYEMFPDAKWHMIGRLQRNKVKYLIGRVAMIHSLDSLQLAWEIDRHAAAADTTVPVLVQVNAANEISKAGIPCEEVIPFVETVYNLRGIKVMGLMMIAPLVEDPETLRPYFHTMKQLFDILRSNDYPHTDIRYLSMGMTNDFEVALAEGSNMIRIGTGIFGSRKKGE